jgi:DNA-binding XRE family transcriptional regulator
MSVRSAVTNQRVADDLNITHSMVSRIRSGDRHPSLVLACRINKMFDWPLQDQVNAINAGNYAVLFEQRLEFTYDRQARA